jgi:DNA-binding NtrC family response regulator
LSGKNYIHSNISRQKEDIKNDDDNGRPLTRLLIVDDDPDIVQVLKLGLLNNGFLVDGFTNPEEALQSFKSNANNFCVVVSDVRMPE